MLKASVLEIGETNTMEKINTAAIDELEAKSSIKEMTYLELGKFLTSLGWHIDWVILGNIYEYLHEDEED